MASPSSLVPSHACLPEALAVLVLAPAAAAAVAAAAAAAAAAQPTAAAADQAAPAPRPAVHELTVEVPAGNAAGAEISAAASVPLGDLLQMTLPAELGGQPTCQQTQAGYLAAEDWPDGCWQLWRHSPDLSLQSTFDL